MILYTESLNQYIASGGVGVNPFKDIMYMKNSWKWPVTKWFERVNLTPYRPS